MARYPNAVVPKVSLSRRSFSSGRCSPWLAGCWPGTWGWLWPLVCVSLAVGLATIRIDSTAPSGAKSLGLILGVCFGALAVLSVTLTVRKRLRPKPPTLPNPGTARAGPAVLDTGTGTSASGPSSFASHQPVADAVRSTGPPSEDPLDRLAKLAQLRDSGALTEAEFDSQKAKILSQM
jgi:Short C-terminal domain